MSQTVLRFAKGTKVLNQIEFQYNSQSFVIKFLQKQIIQSMLITLFYS